MSLYELYRILENVRSSDYKFETIEYIERIISEKERILEDTSATGGPAGSAGAASVGYGGGGVSMGNATTAGMGGVVSSQPSAFPGTLNGVAWASGGGKEGSGDISIPYNPSGANRMFQKLPVAMGKNHKSQTGKKSRQKPLDIKSLKLPIDVYSFELYLDLTKISFLYFSINLIISFKFFRTSFTL